jgi:hypothetical protein
LRHEDDCWVESLDFACQKPDAIRSLHIECRIKIIAEGKVSPMFCRGTFGANALIYECFVVAVWLMFRPSMDWIDEKIGL